MIVYCHNTPTDFSVYVCHVCIRQLYKCDFFFVVFLSTYFENVKNKTKGYLGEMYQESRCTAIWKRTLSYWCPLHNRPTTYIYTLYIGTFIRIRLNVAEDEGEKPFFRWIGHINSVQFVGSTQWYTAGYAKFS